MGEIGKVVGIENEKLVVVLTRTEACAKCGVCSVGLSKKEMFLHAANLCDANVNDFVNIELEQSDFLKAVLIAYGIPLISFFFGSIAGFYLLQFLGFNYQALISFSIGVICMFLAFLWIRSREEHWKSGEFIPVATKVL